MIKLPDNSIFLNRRLTLRYLGGEEQDIPELERCEELLCKAAEPRFIFRLYDRKDCPLPLCGESLCNHIEGCCKVILFAATLGVKADELTYKMRLSSMLEAMICDAAASAMIEGYCEYCDRVIAEKYPDEYLTWRFSPGYGDFPIDNQKPLLDALDAQKRIGLFVNESMLLIPQKSITAVIGVSDKPIKHSARGCGSCNMRETCAFRKDGVRCEQ